MPPPTPPAVARYWPLAQLVLARLREFYREPEAVFWVYGFPHPDGRSAWASPFATSRSSRSPSTSQDGPGGRARSKRRCGRRREVRSSTVHRRRGAAGGCAPARRDLVVIAGRRARSRAIDYSFDPTRPESLLARDAVDDALQRAAGRTDVVARRRPRSCNEPGGRYIDFLVPGLLGMSLMGGGLWGVGFVTVDMRIRKLLKRFLATPMRKSDFLAGIMISRLLLHGARGAGPAGLRLAGVRRGDPRQPAGRGAC